MMKLLIYNDQLKEYIPLEEYEGPLRSRFPEVEIFSTDRDEEATGIIPEVDVVLTLSIPDPLIRLAGKLRWIQSIIVGVDPILSLPSLRKDVLITSAQGIHGPQVSEMVFLFMLAFARRFPEVLRNQGRKVWKPWTGERLKGKKIGIVGIGAIGQEIARKAKAFGMTVYGVDRVDRRDFVDFYYEPKEIARVAGEADYLVLSSPLTPETRNMVGEEVLSVMKPTSYFINVSRGGVVDHEALIRHLKAKKIAGAGLDALPLEPLPETSELWEMENVIITPHVAGNVAGYAKDVLKIFEENLRRFMRGEKKNLINLIDREKGF